MVTQKGHLVQKIPKLRAKFETKNNCSTESLEVYQLCEVSGCVTQKLLRIPTDCNLPAGRVPRPYSDYSEFFLV